MFPCVDFLFGCMVQGQELQCYWVKCCAFWNKSNVLITRAGHHKKHTHTNSNLNKKKIMSSTKLNWVLIVLMSYSKQWLKLNVLCLTTSLTTNISITNLLYQEWLLWNVLVESCWCLHNKSIFWKYTCSEIKKKSRCKSDSLYFFPLNLLIFHPLSNTLSSAKFH